MAVNNRFPNLEALDKLAQAVSIELDGIKSEIPTKEEMDTAISSQIGRVLRPCGTILFSELPELSADVLGNVYDIKEKFTTTADFREGEGKKYPAGTNIAVVQDGDAFKFDVLSGEIDLSNYVEKEEGKGLSSNDYTNEAAAKLGGIADGATKVEASEIEGNVRINGVETSIIEIATDAEVNAVIAKYFPNQTT